MKNYIILIVSVFVLIAFPFLYYMHNAENPNIYLQCLTAVTVFSFSYAAYKFQEQTHEFNRLNRVPHLNVTKDELETKKIIEVKNMSSFVTTHVYIGSFLFSTNGQSKVLYDEIQQQIVPCYPIQQSDVLKSDFRKKFNEEDEQRYGATLEERIEIFITENKENPIYLAIALKAKIMKDDELLLFFYKCNYDENNLLKSLGFTAQHFSAKDKNYKNIFNAAINACNKYKI